MAWKGRLQKLFGDGEELFGAMFKLATGQVVWTPVMDPDTGKQRTGAHGKKQWLRIEPNAYAMVSAFQALRDTLMGKPVSVQVTHQVDQEARAEGVELLANLPAEEIQALRLIAKKAVTMMNRKIGQGARETVPDPITVDAETVENAADEAKRRVLEPEK